MPASKSKAKKKAAGPARGFATTSVAKKVVVEDVATPEEAATPEDGSAAHSNQQDASSQAAAKAPVIDSKEEELDEEEAELQRLAVSLKPGCDKDTSRLLKAIDYDHRLARSFSAFSFRETSLKEDILRLALEEDAQVKVNEVPREQENKLLARMVTIWAVLEKLGVAPEHIETALRAVRQVELEDVFDWLALHAPESELSFEGPRSDSPVPHVFVDTSAPVTPALPSAGGGGTPSLSSVSSSSILPDTPEKAAPAAQIAASTELDDALKQRIINGNADVAKNESEVDLEDDPVAAYVAAKLELLSLDRKPDSTPSTRRQYLEKRMQDASGRYHFSSKQAGKPHCLLRSHRESHKLTDTAYQTERKKFDAAQLRERLSGPAVPRAPKTPKLPKSGPHLADEVDAERVDAERASKADGRIATSDAPDESMFGNMLEEPPTEEVTADGSIVVVRNMSLPRKWTAKPPKSLLEETIRRIDNFATVSFRIISKSRAARAAVTIRWAGGRADEFGMNDIACQDQAQAYNYVAVLALFAIAKTPVRGQLPAVFLELWEELQTSEEAKHAQAFRDRLRLLQAIAAPRLTDANEIRKSVVKPHVSSEDDIVESTPTFATLTPSYELHQAFTLRQMSPPYQSMLPQRAALPIAGFRQTIVQAVEQHQVIILCGETGCGKSTQLPAFILEHWLMQGKPANILCTEPRRISAISLAQRVSKELGDAPGSCGSRGALVGYNVRLESRTSATTRLVYATTGIALRMLEGDSALEDITHLIIDEVHERSIDSDFLMITLRDIMLRRPDLRVVLMSATVDSDKLSAYWDHCPVLQVPGRTFPVTPYFLEDVVELCQYRLEPDSDSPYARRVRRGQAPRRVMIDDDLIIDSDEEAAGELQLDAGKRYSKQTRTTLENIDENIINYELIVQLLEAVCLRSENLMRFSSATLVFMPSLESIRRLNDMLESHPMFGSPIFRIFPLHSTISNDSQSLVFDAMPAGVRKIVIATNIAETGITIPDITCVIDSCRHREMTFDEKRQISRLVESFIARSNAAQRRGRAGRVQEGIAFAMCTKHRHDNQFIDHPEPEMLRLSLQDLALRIKILHFKGTIAEVLLQALDPPALNNIERAVAALVEVKALTANEDITTLGRHLAKLPVDVHLGKLLLLGCFFGCLDATLTIVATLNAKSPWLTPFGRESEADAAKRSFKTENSDFLTLYKAYTSWREACHNGVHQQFTRKAFLGHQTLVQVEELRQQFFNLLVDAGFAELRDAAIASSPKSRVRFLRVPAALDDNSGDARAVMACVASAMFPKLLIPNEGGGWRTLITSAAASIHPSSCNSAHGRRPDFGNARFLAYFNIMQSSNKKLYVHESGPVEEQAVFALCGGEAEFKIAAHTVILDRNRIRARIDPRTAIALKRLRARYAECIAARLKGKTWTPAQQTWWKLIERVVATPEREREGGRKREASARGTTSIKLVANA